MTAPLTPEERDLLAGEYALGLLEGEERARAEGLAQSDPEFGAALARWSAQFAPLLDEVEPVEPPARLWSAVEARLGEPQSVRPAPEATNVVQLRRSLTLWRTAAGAATAIAASLALVLLARPGPEPFAPEAQAPMVAMVGEEGADARLIATYDPESGSLVVAAAALKPAANHEHELWFMPAGGGAPHPMGIVRAGKPMRMKMPRPMATELAAGMLAVSVEPVGGSPTGAPTGPVIASGRFSAT